MEERKHRKSHGISVLVFCCQMCKQINVMVGWMDKLWKYFKSQVSENNNKTGSKVRFGNGENRRTFQLETSSIYPLKSFPKLIVSCRNPRVFCTTRNPSIMLLKPRERGAALKNERSENNKSKLQSLFPVLLGYLKNYLLITPNKPVIGFGLSLRWLFLGTLEKGVVYHSHCFTQPLCAVVVIVSNATKPSPGSTWTTYGWRVNTCIITYTWYWCRSINYSSGGLFAWKPLGGRLFKKLLSRTALRVFIH